MKQIPIRSMLTASPGNLLVEWDLSQAETWVVAYLANEETMKQSLLYGDIHTDTASHIFTTPKEKVTTIQRFLGKKGNHMLSYDAVNIERMGICFIYVIY